MQPENRQHLIVDDFQRIDRVSALGTTWRAVTDRVMGGVSAVSLDYCNVEDRRGLRLTGLVRLDNNGGFVQMGLDLCAPDDFLNAESFTGVELLVHGNDERYSVHLRTADTLRPWQSYRAHFTAVPRWQTRRLPFAGFTPHRLTAPLDLRRLRRLGIVAIGRAFHADFTIGELRFY